MHFQGDPGHFSWFTYAWVVGLSAWGGVVSYIRKVRASITEPFSLMELVGEIVTSGFVGVLTFWLCTEAHLSTYLTAALVGISGHMGSRAVSGFEMLLKQRLNLPRDNNE